MDVPCQGSTERVDYWLQCVDAAWAAARGDEENVKM